MTRGKQAEESRKRSLRWKPDGTLASKHKEVTLGALRAGRTVDEATALWGGTPAAHYKWRQKDKAYATEVDRILERRRSGRTYPPCPFTPEFRETYLAADYDQPINPPHLVQAIDFINQIGPAEFGLVLMPPGHAKSSLSEDLLCAAIANEPESRCVIISKTQSEAQKRLLKVQARMEDVDFYADFIDEWGPFKPEGRGQRPWAATKMTVARKSPKQRDYSLQAIGIKGQIQGQSIDWALLDDIADDNNQSPQEVESQANYIRQSVNTRFRKSGRGLCIGTRQNERDIYRKLLDEGFFDHVLILPAIYPDGSPLWPDRYSDEEYDRMREKAGPRVWSLTYQQEDVVSEGQAFPLDLIESAYDYNLRAHQVPDGSTVVIGIDPAAAGYTAGVAIAVNRVTGERVVIDVWNEKDLMADGGDKREGVVQFILELAARYKARRVTLEANSAFTYVSSAPHLRSGLSDIGCALETVRAGKAHHDDDAMSLVLSNLFSNGIIKIPAQGASKQVYRDLVFQLLSWRPYDKKLIRDVVRALYYAEMAARRVVKSNAHNSEENQTPGLSRWGARMMTRRAMAGAKW